MWCGHGQWKWVKSTANLGLEYPYRCTPPGYGEAASSSCTAGSLKGGRGGGWSRTSGTSGLIGSSVLIYLIYTSHGKPWENWIGWDDVPPHQGGNAPKGAPRLPQCLQQVRRRGWWSQWDQTWFPMGHKLLIHGVRGVLREWGMYTYYIYIYILYVYIYTQYIYIYIHTYIQYIYNSIYTQYIYNISPILMGKVVMNHWICVLHVVKRRTCRHSKYSQHINAVDPNHRTTQIGSPSVF